MTLGGSCTPVEEEYETSIPLHDCASVNDVVVSMIVAKGMVKKLQRFRNEIIIAVVSVWDFFASNSKFEAV